MPKKPPPGQQEFSRRERQLMDAVYRLGRATAAEIRTIIPDPPSYTAVRTLLGILLEKGHLRVESSGGKNFYEPTVPRDEMARSVIAGVLTNFFEGSVERVVATLLDREEVRLSDEELVRLAELVEQARKEGR